MLDVWLASLGPTTSVLLEEAVRAAMRRTPPAPPQPKKQEPTLVAGYEVVRPLHEIRFTLDANDFTRSTFTGEIDVESIDTGNADRDAHLRANDFLDVANHPKITFASMLSDEPPRLLTDTMP